MYRHGDVLITPAVVPDKAKEKQGLVLAEGEVTGHLHQITEGKAQLYAWKDKTYLKVLSDVCCLTHEEHKALQIPMGDYEIKIQREYSPEGWRYVQD